MPCETGIYLRRWVLETPWWSLRLHHWLHGDDMRHTHDHPWAFWTLVLKGAYWDIVPQDHPFKNPAERLRPGTLRFRPAHHAHTVKLDTKDCWTLVLTGPQVRRWGFWVGRRWKKANKYFLEHGVHPCE